MENKKIAILGGGNLGASIAEGLLKSEVMPSRNITVTRRKVHLLGELGAKGINIGQDNIKAVADADIIIFAVKPFQLKELMLQVKPALDVKKHILISVVTGASLNEIQSMATENIPLFRAMPNTAIAVQESMTCISSRHSSPEDEALVLSIFEKLGRAIIIEEELMDAATVLGACGIAYCMRYIRAASQGGIEIGFNAGIAQLIAAQTVKGAATLLQEDGYHPEREIDKVTTPQGCTIAGLNEMEHQGFSSALIKGITTSYKKIAKISEDFSK